MKVTGAYLNMGAKFAEGNFNNSYNQNNKNFQRSVEYQSKMNSLKEKSDKKDE